MATHRAAAGRTALLVVFDLAAWSFAVVAASVLVTGAPAGAGFAVVVAHAVTVAVAFVTAGRLTGLYRIGRRVGSAAELRPLGMSAVVASAVGVAGALAVTAGTMSSVVSMQAFVLAVPLAVVVVGAGRAVIRRRSRVGCRGRGDERALVFGAGEVGASLVRRLLVDETRSFQPVGFIDDDPRLARHRIESVPVVGDRASLGAAARAASASVVIVAVADPGPELLEDVSRLAASAGLRVLVVPPLTDMLRGLKTIDELRGLTIEELTGRPPALEPCATSPDYLLGRTVLVTGAGGSIGSELCRQISALGPRRLVMLDRDETALQAVQLAVSGSGLLDSPDIVLADIRDGDEIARVFARVAPDVVFHAAALKHLPMLEAYPTEGWKTNVIGTLNVLRAAESVGVTTFVNVSTDKAANPTSVLGASKRLAERLTSAFGERTGRRYLSVRFGNVLGSRGSLVPLFSELIRAGRALTVTDPAATRYFMSIPEACALVTEAGAIGAAGEVLILDMGDPVNILDVANRMIAMSGRDVGVVFTGLRPGEKLHEELIGEGEVDRRPVHPKIAHADVSPILPADLDLDRFLATAPALARGRRVGSGV